MSNHAHAPTEVLDWLKEQGIDPADIPWDVRVTFSLTDFTTPMYLRNSKGNLYLDELQEAAARTLTTFPIITRPSHAVRTWLETNPYADLQQ